MRKLSLLLATTALISTAALANVASLENADSKNCEAIVKACKNAGYARKGDAGNHFWKDCMRPLILGEQVKKVKIDPATGEACRLDKILELKAELKVLEQSNKS